MPPRRRPPADGSSPEYRVEALAKGLRVLTLFTETNPVWRVTDIADAVAIPMPTVYRIMMTLAAEGYLEVLPSGEYRPGVRTLTLGGAALRSLDLVQLALPRLQALAGSTGETINLGVLTGDQVLYLVRIRNSDLVTANIQVGSTLPAVHTSIGKLLLAHLDDGDLRSRVSDSSFHAHAGPHAKGSLAELSDELAATRRRGWALQDEELAFGLRSVAGPVRDASGQPVAGINVAVQSRDWTVTRIETELQPRVLEACREISALLGHHEQTA